MSARRVKRGWLLLEAGTDDLSGLSDMPRPMLSFGAQARFRILLLAVDRLPRKLGARLPPWRPPARLVIRTHLLQFAPNRGKHLVVELTKEIGCIGCLGAEAAEPFEFAVKRFELRHRVGAQVLIVPDGIFPEQVPRQPAHQSTHAIFQSGDRRSSEAQARHGPECEIVKSREVRRCARLPFGELESRAEIRMSREQFAFFPRWRREPVAPKRDVM